MGKNRHKRPVSAAAPQDRPHRAVTQRDPEGYQHLTIAWHFQCMDQEGPWPCDLADLRLIQDRLHQYEDMKWSELAAMPSSHPMPVEELSPQAQERLEELRHQPATLYQFDIKGGNGRQRLWGMRRENIFQILWWDPEHTVYPVVKKHT